MKTTLLRIIVIIIALAGVWYFWPKSSVEPEATPTPEVTLSPTPSPSVLPTKTPIKTPTPSPKAPEGTATPTATAAPTISAVTAYQMTTEPAGWWVRIVGTLANGCMQLTGASFSRDGNTFMVSLPAQSTGQVCTQIAQQFTQTVRLSDLSLASGLYTVFVNNRSWTSFIVPTPTPSPLY